MRISHQAIYQAPLVRGRGALKRELVAFYRSRLRLHAHTKQRRGGFITPEVMISQRPAEVSDREFSPDTGKAI